MGSPILLLCSTRGGFIFYSLTCHNSQTEQTSISTEREKGRRVEAENHKTVIRRSQGIYP